MRLRVIFECVTFGKDARAKRWVRGDLSPDSKEACFGTVSGKHIENIRCGAAGSVIDGQPDSALLRFKVRENFAVPGAIPSQSRIEPEKVMCRPWERAEPSTHRQDPDDGRQPAG
jgi:hypothetical protein